MKDQLINKIITYLLNHPSKLLQKIEIQLLYQLSAKAFHNSSKWILLKSNQEMLEEYARFTKEMASKENIDLNRLYHLFYQTGRLIQTISLTKDPEILSDLIRLLYQNIEIKIEGYFPGEIIVKRCYFSSYYTCKECIIMSNMDKGLIDGIIQGGKFYFIERISEGHTCCKAIKEGAK